jgi:hypothetical protein
MMEDATSFRKPSYQGGRGDLLETDQGGFTIELCRPKGGAGETFHAP